MELKIEKLKLIGMHCASCAVTIEKKLKSLNGVADAIVNFAAEEAEIRYDPKKITLKDIVNAIRNVGYDVYKEEAYFTVENISSIDEESIIENKLKSLHGVIDVSASHIVKSISVTFNPLSIKIDDIKKYLENMGYKIVSIKGEVEIEDAESKVLKREIVKLKKLLQYVFFYH